ncbi:MAG: hypothetical protein ACFFCW_28160 [Candidatus Hodarchaeota archaeon]
MGKDGELTSGRDGSTREPKSNGYWRLDILGTDVEGEDLTPVYGVLYCQEVRGFSSENSQILSAMDRVRDGVGNRAIVRDTEVSPICHC